MFLYLLQSKSHVVTVDILLLPLQIIFSGNFFSFNFYEIIYKSVSHLLRLAFSLVKGRHKNIKDYLSIKIVSHSRVIQLCRNRGTLFIVICHSS